jgi:hypothetical protein
MSTASSASQPGIDWLDARPRVTFASVLVCDREWPIASRANRPVLQVTKVLDTWRSDKSP